MQLQTLVDLPTDLPEVTHRRPILLMGSCFAEHIGRRLEEYKFRVERNPYGILYNPLSMAQALDELRLGVAYDASRLFFHNDLWHSAMHHGSFSRPTAEETLQTIGRRQNSAREVLESSPLLMLTLGTAHVYERVDTGQVVGNCHRLPARCFGRRLISVSEATERLVATLEPLLSKNPDVQVLMTVSPIRHVGDGLHANQLSKSTLLLAVEALTHAFPGRIGYFPAYELLMDELRDYRFYADDLVHPSALAVEWVWSKFVEACMSPDTRAVLKELDGLKADLGHRPFRPQGDAYRAFVHQILLNIERLQRKYPTFDFQNEIDQCHTRLMS